MGSCVSSKDASALTEGERELARRREALLQRNRREQQQWRQRRLRDVVVVLIDRGEVSEGVPLAFQPPFKAEVAARRHVRQTRRMSPQARQQLDLATAVTEAEENRRYDPAALKIMRTPLRELLAAGRPADCLPAPDIMQLLLEGKEVALTDEDEDDEEDMTTATEEDPATSTTQLHGSPDGITPTTDGPSRSENPSNGNTTSHTNMADRVDPMAPPPPPPETADEQARRIARNKKEEAIIRELHHRQQPRRRRRRTAEETYGAGVEYTPNVYNSYFHDEVLNTPLTAQSVVLRRQRSSHRLLELLSPLSPSKGRRRRSAASGGGTTSAFEGRVPAEPLLQYTIHEDSFNANRVLTADMNLALGQSHHGSPFDEGSLRLEQSRSMNLSVSVGRRRQGDEGPLRE